LFSLTLASGEALTFQVPGPQEWCDSIESVKRRSGKT
jgi:hypothetical protein